MCRRSLDRILYQSKMSRSNVAHMQIWRMGSSGRRKVYGFSLNNEFPPSKVFFLERLFPEDFGAVLASCGTVVPSSSRRESSLSFTRFDSGTSGGSSASRLRSLKLWVKMNHCNTGATTHDWFTGASAFWILCKTATKKPPESWRWGYTLMLSE